MTSDYKVCINCVVGGMKIQNMIPIQVYINVHMHQHSIDTGFNTILHDQRSITSEGIQEIHLFYLFLHGGIGGAKLGGGPILRSAITPLLPKASFSFPPEFS